VRVTGVALNSEVESLDDSHNYNGTRRVLHLAVGFVLLSDNFKDNAF